LDKLELIVGLVEEGVDRTILEPLFGSAIFGEGSLPLLLYSFLTSIVAAAFFNSSVQSGLLMMRISCSATNSCENFGSAGGEVLGSSVLFVKPEGSATMLVSEVLVFMFVHNVEIRYRRGYI